MVTKLEEFIRRNPALANVLYFSTKLGTLKPLEALTALRAGQITATELGMDPPAEQLWELTEAYYQRLLEMPEPRPRIAIMGQLFTIEEVLEHIRAKTKIGETLVAMHEKLLREMEKRMRI